MTDAVTYRDTVDRLEPHIHPIDAAAYYASAAISLKRIADVLEFAQRVAIEAMGQDPDTAAILRKVFGE